METFSTLLVICAGNSPVTGEFSAQRPGTRSFDVFFDLRLNKQLSKQSWGWWFATPSCPLWRHCNVCRLLLVPLSNPCPQCLYRCFMTSEQWIWYPFHRTHHRCIRPPLPPGTYSSIIYRSNFILGSCQHVLANPLGRTLRSIKMDVLLPSACALLPTNTNFRFPELLWRIICVCSLMWCIG